MLVDGGLGLMVQSWHIWQTNAKRSTRWPRVGMGEGVKELRSWEHGTPKDRYFTTHYYPPTD